MKEATWGKGFDVILTHEFNTLSGENARLAYLIACIAYMHGAAVRRRHVIASIGGTDVQYIRESSWNPELLWNPFERLVLISSTASLRQPARWVPSPRESMHVLSSRGSALLAHLLAFPDSLSANALQLLPRHCIQSRCHCRVPARKPVARSRLPHRAKVPCV